MTPLRIPHLSLAVLFCAGPAGHSGEPIAYGLHLGVADAQGDFRNVMGSRASIEAGLSARIPFSPKLSLRPTVEFQRFPVLENGYSYRSSRYNDLGTETARWSAWSFGADGILRPEGPSGRVYFLLGAYLKMWRLHSYGSFTSSDKINGTQTYAVDDTSTKDEPALGLGVGWSLTRHAAVETRITFGSYRRQAYNTLHLRLALNL